MDQERHGLEESANACKALVSGRQVNIQAMTFRYVFAVSLIAVAAIASFFVLNHALSIQRYDSELVNISGRQRMLSQSTALFANQLVNARTQERADEARMELRNALNLMRSSHLAMTHATGRFAGAEYSNYELNRAYFSGEDPLDPKLNRYFNDLEGLLNVEFTALRQENSFYKSILAAHETGLLQKLNGVVVLYEEQSNAKLFQAKTIHAYVIVGMLILLVFETLYIFRPMVRNMRAFTSELLKKNQEMAELSVNDALTKLPNRAGFSDRLDVLLDAQEGGDRVAAIMLLDLDKFKNINDTLGHPAGDQVLIEVGQRIHAQLKPSDTVARLGGDEFAVLLRRLRSSEDAAIVAKQLIDAIMKPIFIDGSDLTVGTSIGIALFPDKDSSPEQLMKHADLALYEAKRNGRGQYCFFSSHMQADITQKSETAQQLRKAFQDNEFEVFLQPIHNLQSGEVQFAESLIRWRKPDGTYASAHEFIDVIDEFMMAEQIEDFVFENVFSTIKRWRDGKLPCPVVTLNVSARNLRQPHFVERLCTSMRRHQLPPDVVAIEILESVLIERGADVVANNIEALHKNGFDIMLDDFGTGYASLSHLMDFPVSTVKIDKTFVQGLTKDDNESSKQIVSAVISLARDLGIKTIAEGVETSEQLAYLQLRGCDWGQGYYFARPEPIKTFEDYLHKMRAAKIHQAPAGRSLAI